MCNVKLAKTLVIWVRNLIVGLQRLRCSKSLYHFLFSDHKTSSVAEGNTKCIVECHQKLIQDPASTLS